MSDRKSIVYLRESDGNIELVIGPGDHTCKVVPLTYSQLVRLVADGAEVVARVYSSRQQ